MLVNETFSHWSDLAFQAAMAGYLVALACYLIEFAQHRTVRPVAAKVAAMAGAGGSALAASPGGAGTVSPGGTNAETGTGSLEQTPRPPLGERAGRIAVVVTMVGLAANILAIVFRGLAAHRPPLGNMYEFVLVICAGATLCWLIVQAKFHARSAASFVMAPVVILAFVGGTVLYTPAGPLVPALNSYWKWVHVTTVSLSSGVLMVSGAASLMYIVRARYERRLAAFVAFRGADPVAGLGRSDTAGPGPVTAAVGAGPEEPSPYGIGARLPALATLDRLAYRTAIVGFPLFTFAVIAGALWAEVAWGTYWGWDPKETCSLVTWVLYAGYLHARATAGWRGSRAAYISVLGFASILFNLFFVNVVVSGLHSYAGLN